MLKESIFNLLLLTITISLVSCYGAKTNKTNLSTNIITPGAVWPDDSGNHIQAHGGGIIKVADTWYWFGEYRGKDVEKDYRYVGCYSSTDLVHWMFLNKIKFSAPDGVSPDGWILERPKVYYNEKSKKYVMYFHLDDKNYKLAEVGVAVSDKIDKGYQIVKHFRPFGNESRDIGQFIDDDGTAYLIYESRPTKGFFIASLTDDYMDVKENVSFIKEPIEGGAIVHYEGLYYIIGSHLTGWNPNPNLYSSSKSLRGPWAEFKNIAPPETNTYNSQSTMLLKVKGKKNTTVLYMGDMWKPNQQWDSRYLWMPMEIGEGNLRLPQPKPFKMDVKDGISEIID